MNAFLIVMFNTVICMVVLWCRDHLLPKLKWDASREMLARHLVAMAVILESIVITGYAAISVSKDEKEFLGLLLAVLAGSLLWYLPLCVVSWITGNKSIRE